MTDLDQLDIMRRAITALGLGQVAPEELVAEARASSSRREQDRGMLADQRARIKDLESALRDLGVNPGGDLPGEVRAINNRAAGDSAAAQHDLDCALRERDAKDATIAELRAHFSGLGQRIADLERDLSAKDAALKTAHAALNRVCEIIDAPVPVCPDDAVEAVKGLIGAADGHYRRADRAEATLAEMVKALDDCNAPRHYLDDDGREAAEVSAAERVHILAEIARAERALREQVERNAAVSRDHLSGVARALDDVGAPRQAGAVTLSPAARVRAIPR